MSKGHAIRLGLSGGVMGIQAPSLMAANNGDGLEIHMPSGNQMWQAGKFLKKMEVYDWEHHLKMVHFPANHVWLRESIPYPFIYLDLANFVIIREISNTMGIRGDIMKSFGTLQDFAIFPEKWHIATMNGDIVRGNCRKNGGESSGQNQSAMFGWSQLSYVGNQGKKNHHSARCFCLFFQKIIPCFHV